LRISFHGNQFHRTHPQEHNKQLIVLLHQLEDILEKMTGQVMKATRDSPATALAPSSSSAHLNRGSEQSIQQMEAVLKSELSPFFDTCHQHNSDLSAQILSPLVNALDEYFR
jgi:hypothetical protein